MAYSTFFKGLAKTKTHIFKHSRSGYSHIFKAKIRFYRKPAKLTECFCGAGFIGLLQILGIIVKFVV